MKETILRFAATAALATALHLVPASAPAQTVAELTSAAKKDPAAMYKLGMVYLFGDGADADPKDAYAWFRKAAGRDHAPGIHMVGFCLANGIGTSVNEKEAFKNYLKAAEADIQEAQLAVAHCYEKGLGITKNEGEALRWYQKLAEKGHTEAEFVVGRMYYAGQGTTENYAEAVKWFRRAADKGYHRAQFSLGTCYSLGQGGVPRDYVEAMKWVILSSELGDEEAVKRRNDFARLYRLTDEQVADAEKRAGQFAPKAGSQ
jgi:uncharacterized protein